MRDFARISTSIWNSRKFGTVDSDAKLLYFYLHTCPQVNSIGAFILKEGYAYEDLGWDLSRYRKAVTALSQANLIGVDTDEKVIRIVGFLTFSPISNVSHAKGAIKLALSLPDCGEKLIVLKDLSLQRYCSKDNDLNRAVAGLSHGCIHPARTETETETETETKKEKKKDSVAEATDSDAVDSRQDQDEGEKKQDLPPQEDPPPHPDDDLTKQMFDRAVAYLGRNGVKERQARSFVGRCRKTASDPDIIAAFTECSRAGITDPIPWITARLRPPDAIDIDAIMKTINPDGTLKPKDEPNADP